MRKKQTQQTQQTQQTRMIYPVTPSGKCQVKPMKGVTHKSERPEGGPATAEGWSRGSTLCVGVSGLLALAADP
jgi:hypothetical protein